MIHPLSNIMKNKFCGLIISVLLIFNIIQTITYFQSKSNHKKITICLEQKISRDSLNVIYTKKYIDIYQNPELPNMLDSLASQFKINNKLVFYFRSDNCSKCVIKWLSQIDESEKKIGTNNIVLIGQDSLYNPYSGFLEKYKKRYCSYWCRSNALLKYIGNVPFFFLKRDSDAQFFYIPDLLPDYMNNYFDHIESYFMKEDNKL